MKNKNICIFWVVFFLVIFEGVSFAQTVTLTFTGQDAGRRLRSVIIKNLTKGWEETISWPDTVLVMQSGTGIDEVEAQSIVSLKLLQNNPNPFHGTTDVLLAVKDAGMVTLEIVDVQGHIIETQYVETLHPGIHQFRVNLSAVGTYVMNARQNGQVSSIKMVCNGAGSRNSIEYAGVSTEVQYIDFQQSNSKNSVKGITTNPFDLGDQMEYVGFSVAGHRSRTITQVQNGSQTIVLQFIPPTVVVYGITDISQTSAVVECNIMPEEGLTVYNAGVCWNTTGNPDFGDHSIGSYFGTGDFSCRLTGIHGATTYYVRAFVQSNMGGNFSEEVSFTTSLGLACPESPTVTDMDNNIYNTVQLGSQCWMMENLRTTKYADGTPIAYWPDSIAHWNYPYGSDTVTYGRMYSWSAVKRDICPTGWHVPSYEEWTQLTDYMSNQSQYMCGGDSISIAKALASTRDWQNSTRTCAPGNTPSDNNASGFCAYPAGYFSTGSWSYSFYSQYALLWSSTEYDSTKAYSCGIGKDSATVEFSMTGKSLSLSVRCIRD